MKRMSTSQEPSSPSPSSDKQTMKTRVTLLDKLQSGEQGPDHDAAWQRFHDLYVPLIRYWLGKWNIPRKDLDDLCQEVMIILVRRLPEWTYDPAKGRFRGYVKTIVSRKAMRYFEQQKNKPGGIGGTDHQDILASEQDHKTQDLDEVYERAWQRRAFELACEHVQLEVGDKQWFVFEQAILCQRPAEEVAKEASMKRGNVYVICTRIRTKLREYVSTLDE